MGNIPIEISPKQKEFYNFMGFPIIIPQLLLLMKISTPAFATVVQQGWWQMVLLLVALDIMVVMLSIILFPFLWKDKAPFTFSIKHNLTFSRLFKKISHCM